MEITIKLSRKDVERILKQHALKEVPVHTAGKNIFIMEKYGTWEIEVSDKDEP